MVKKFWNLEQCLKSSKDNDSDFGSQCSQKDQIQKNIEQGTTLQVAKGIIFEYFKESSIHGFKYVGNHRQSLSHRIIWLFALVLSITTCYFQIKNIYDQRQNNPVIVSFNEKQTSIWEIPFPTVTICPETKTRTEIFNFTEIYWKLNKNESITEDEQFYWEALSQTCDAEGMEVFPFEKRFTNASDLNEAMSNAAPSLNETILSTYWRGSWMYEFERVLTEEGICFNLNSLKSTYYRDELKNTRIQDDNFYEPDFLGRNLEWDVENGYKDGSSLNALPGRIIEPVEAEALSIWLGSYKKDDDLICRDTVKGYKVIFHTPGDEPQVSKKYVHVAFGKSVVILIKPKIVKASEGLRNYESNMRQCFYQDEHNLRYFKVYSQPNCQLECLANMTLDKCGCVKFSMPRNSSHKVCGSRSRVCVSGMETRVRLLKFERANRPNQLDNESTHLCNCLPLCTSIQYKAELGDQTEFDYFAIKRAFNFTEKESPGYQVTEITVNFKEEVFNGLRRSELYTTADVIANFGGLLGLFMGVSILSLVELVYFFTIKLWDNLNARKRMNRHVKKFNENP